MVNAPNFAQTSDKGDMRTFAMGFPPDPRAINWHVDRYVRNQNRDNYFVSQYHGYNKEDLDPKKWGIQTPLFSIRGWVFIGPGNMIIRHGIKEDPGTYKVGTLSLAGHWYGSIRNHLGEIVNPYYQEQQIICPNLSLTRYDWQPNALPRYYKMGRVDENRAFFQYGNEIPTFNRLSKLMAVTQDDIYSCRFEPDYLAKRNGVYLHGPSYEFYDRKKGK